MSIQSQKYLPVHASYHGAEDGWQSTGISFEDVKGMRPEFHKLNSYRKQPTPAWVNDDALLRETIVLFMEERAALVRFREGQLYRAQAGTLLERLDRATARMQEKRPQLEEQLKRLCARYTGESEPKKRKVLAELIENCDTQIRIVTRGASIACACLHYYYRLGMDSVGVAEALQLKPPHVRQMLYRLKCAYEQVAAIRAGLVKVIPFVPRIQHVALDAKNRPVTLCIECGQPCKKKERKCCSRKCAMVRRNRQKRASGPPAEKLKFCSPTCKTNFTEHPWETIKKRFGIDLAELKKTEGADYASYVVYAVSLKQAPMPAQQWRILRDGGKW